VGELENAPDRQLSTRAVVGALMVGSEARA
jgi:hypothetical protein